MMTRLLAMLILLACGLGGCTFGINPDYKADPGQGFQRKPGTSEGGGGGGGGY